MFLVHGLFTITCGRWWIQFLRNKLFDATCFNRHDVFAILSHLYFMFYRIYLCKLNIDMLIRLLDWQYDLYTYKQIKNMFSRNMLCVIFDMDICNDRLYYIVCKAGNRVAVWYQWGPSGWNIMPQPKPQWLGTFSGAERSWKCPSSLISRVVVLQCP